uniref:Glyco_18 domain-containing protein n=2 Tax=Caenorhabditis tropicalis TaxID=1561998 RepID=A0A1I7T6C0_9PELO
MIKTSEYSQLSLSRKPAIEDEKKSQDTCRSLIILLLIAVACLPISYALTILFMHFNQEVPEPPITSTTLQTTTSTKSSLHNAAACGKRIIGYYTEWENADVTKEQLDKLTHVIYLFAAVQENGTIKLEGEKSERRFYGLKNEAITSNPELKVMIGVGGHANSPRFSPIVSDTRKRGKLIDSIVTFIDENYLDGVEIFWVWSYETNKVHHSKFIRELRKKLTDLKIQKKRSEEYLISVIVPPSISHLTSGYYLNEIMKDVDFLNVLSYDYYFNGNQIGPHSPIYGGTRGNVDETMKFLACRTGKPSKLNMAVPFYGTYWVNASFPLLDDSDNIWKEKGSAGGPFAVRWNELIPKGWDKESAKFHEKSKTSYIWIPETKHFLTFENERSLQEKAKYVKNHNIGGVVIWAIDQDDVANTLLNVVSSSDICSVKDKDIVEYLC